MTDKHTLIRAVGVKGAVMMDLGSIVRTDVFVSLGLAAGLAGIIWRIVYRRFMGPSQVRGA